MLINIISKTNFLTKKRVCGKARQANLFDRLMLFAGPNYSSSMSRNVVFETNVLYVPILSISVRLLRLFH